MKILEKTWLGNTIILLLFLTACSGKNDTDFSQNPPVESPDTPATPVIPDTPGGTAPNLLGSQLQANAVTSSRSLQTVWNLYQATLVEQGFNSNNLFKYAPVIDIRPNYYPGKLSQTAVSTTLDLLNAYRALYGINDDITTHPERFDWGQYGATAEEILGKLTHYIVDDPTDLATLQAYMTADELDKAVAATNAGIDETNNLLWSGNVTTTNNVVLAVKKYVDDTENVHLNSAGHRFNMLDLTGKHAVFGAGLGRYSAMNIYGDPYGTINNEDYYAWPPEGWFPKQALPDNALWTIVLGREYRSSVEGDYDHPYSSKMKIHVAYDGIEAEATILEFASNYNDDFPTITFALPTFVKESIKSSSSAYDNAGVVETTVTVTGIKDSQGRNHYLRYTTKFFQELN